MTTRWHLVGFVWVLAGVSGCVTTTNQRYVDIDAAYEKRIDLGMKYLEVDKRDNARRQFTQALNMKKNGADAHHGIALVHQANGEVEPAGRAFQRALKLSDKKSLAPISVSYGKYLVDRDRTKDACPYFEKAAADFDYDRRAEALFLAGQCASMTGNTARVKPAYEHALNLQENYSPALIELAEIYFQEAEYARSKRLLDRHMQINQPTSRSLWLGIRLERVFGNRDKESSYALSLKNLHPYSDEYLEYRRLVEQ